MRTCFFIGHRDAPESLRSQLDEAIERHIMEYGVTDFVVGKYGNFDRMAAQAVQRAKQRYTNIRLTLLLAYYDPIQQSNLPPGFDGSLYPDGLENVRRRYAIVHANRYMVRHSEYLIAYDKGLVGNTRELVLYARRREKKEMIHIENMAEKM